MITDRGYCKHSNGQDLARCYKYDINSFSGCEAPCTSSNSCVGYYHRNGYTGCYLLPSSQSFSICPDGFTFQQLGPMANTSDDLVEGVYSGFSCYAKNEGSMISNFANF